MSLDTLRCCLSRGQRLLAGALQCMAAVFIPPWRCLRGLLNVWTVDMQPVWGRRRLGNDSRGAAGFCCVVSILPVRPSSALWDAGHAVTDFVAHGRDGGSPSSTRSWRKYAPAVRAIIDGQTHRRIQLTTCGGCGYFDERNRHYQHQDALQSNSRARRKRECCLA
jgi:hypothetical protein